jgi:hypothetical protein
MSGSAIFDLAVGIVFVFLLVSLICSQISDKISLWLRWRAKDLEAGLRSFVVGENNKDLVAKLYNNELIKSLVPQDVAVTQILNKTPLRKFVYPGATPFGIPAKTFVLALLDSVLPGAQGKDTVDKMLDRVAQLPDDSPLKSSLTSILKTANDDLDTARKNIEDWYDATMYRTTVIYQRNMWGLSLLLGLIIAIFLNVDTIAVGTNLWHDSALRTAVASVAAQYAVDGKPEEANAKINSLNLPIGWQVAAAPAGAGIFGRAIAPIDWTTRPPERPVGFWAYVSKLVGWLITAIAAAQGAPFWFDLLRKLTKG